MSSSTDSNVSIASEPERNRDDAESEIDDDLFGDGDEDDIVKPAGRTKIRTLDDSDLDSGDDEGRQDRAESQEAVIQVQREEVVQPIRMPRHVIPEPDDNELYLVKVPKFLALQPHSYNLQTFQPPTTDHHSKTVPSDSFDAYETAITTIRWRHSPSDPSDLQSNARIIRWSDGSMTLQMATNATEQHEIRANAMAPPQSNPAKPTAMSAISKGRRQQHYNTQDEQYTYLASANRTAYGVRLTNKFTANATILPSARKDTMEDIEASMQAIQAKYKAEQENVGLKITNEIIDPEKLKQEALKQEREADRRARKAERDGEKQLRFGRAGRAGGGLTIDDLEGSGRPRQQRGPKNQRRARRDSLSDEEEEMYGRRGGSQDIYDMEDDFLVGSEEDVEGSEEDAEGEDDIDAVIERNERAQRHASPKRARPDDEDKSHASPVARQKRRRVVSDDEDE